MIYCHSVAPSCYIENQSGGRLRLPSLPIPSDSCKHDDFWIFNRARRNSFRLRRVFRHVQFTRIGDCHCSPLSDDDCDYHIYNQKTLSAKKLIFNYLIKITADPCRERTKSAVFFTLYLTNPCTDKLLHSRQ